MENYNIPVIMNREKWLDIAKGIGIIAVVVGHSGYREAGLLYWFHMPLFFVISGFLFKPCFDWKSLLSWVNRRAQQFLIPYVSFLGIIVVAEFYVNNRYVNLYEISKAFFFNLFPGGRFIGGFYTPFWFITCLFITQVVFAIILMLFKSTTVQLLIIGIAYLGAHFESEILKTHQIIIPWDIDVTLLTLAYYSIGYYCKKALGKLSPFIALVSVSLSIMLIILGRAGLINYSINVKYLTCDHIVLDLIIPIVITVAIFAVCQQFSRVNILKYIGALGNYSLPIMYLHLPFNIIAHQYFNNGPVLFLMIGLFIPFILSYFALERFRITQLCLLGVSRLSPPHA
ncbi:acyltransferase family protein [Pelotomaculum isophthalicicum JI]|uniref:Acyltransferase family protein n=1 Tax=Pelotomaculum isophthalicicum JI TaxID=947010 RepID=A0A9X4JWM9_9FIRM|nr:acyltransferase family protein [Pelotomaculum isophthalicicum]MDF9409732.1 acyltransferase family protein [Pelotomaculum isophthalicicum JI]